MISGTSTAITGIAPPGDVVSVAIDGESPANVTANAAGVWARPVRTFTPGTHRITAQIGTDPPSADNSASVSFTVRAPVTLAITSPAPGTLTSPVSAIKGTAQPNAAVVLQIDGTVVLTMAADASGMWSYPVATQPRVGSHTIMVTSGADTASVTIIVPGTSTGAALAITTPANGSSVSVLNAISGTAAPGSAVSVQIDGGAGVSATADATGAWQVPLPSGLPLGAHTIVASSSGSPNVTVNVTVATGGSSSSSSGGVPDWVWLAGAGTLVVWWVWRTIAGKSAAKPPVQNPQVQPPLTLQSVVVSKDLASTESQAHTIASKFVRGDAGAADETGTSFRFRQRAPAHFIPGSLRTIHPTNGVAMIMGHLQ
jgi:hypothetical protein